MPSEASRRVLITGIGGFTGRYVAERFEAAGYSVGGTGLGAASAFAGGPGVAYEQASLDDPEALARAVARVRPHVVVHLAAIANVAHGSADELYRVNLVGTRNLLVALRREAPPLDCVLLASSANVYGNAVGGVLSEAAEPNPANDYAVSKLAMEYVARTFLPDLPIVLARPFNYTGRGQTEHFVIPKIVNGFRRGAAALELGNLDVWREFSDVRAVAEAYLALVEAPPVGEAVNVASGVAHSLREVIEICRAHTGRDVEVRVNPDFVRRNEVPRLVGDASRLRRIAPGWSPPPLADTVRWMLDEPLGPGDGSVGRP